MTLKGFFLLVIGAVIGVSGNLLLRAGVDRAGGFPGELSQIPRALFNLAREPLFDLGMSFYVIAALVWFRIISTQQLSIAYPILVSLVFVLVTIGAVILFKEPLTVVKIFGLAIVIVGIFVTSRG